MITVKRSSLERVEVGGGGVVINYDEIVGPA